MTSLTKPIQLSFELFPARTHQMRYQLGATVTQLNQYQPKFYSVTHGAFENPGDSSDETLQALPKLTNSPIAAHIAASNAPKHELMTWVRTLYHDGIRHFVALRGDAFRKGDNNYFQSGLEFTKALREQYSDITIYVSAYPEGHQDAVSANNEIDYLKQKLDAGANHAITQFFFDVDNFYQWYETFQAKGMDKQIIAGILPISNYEKTLKMAQYCGTEIPTSLAYQYGKYMNDLEAQAKLSIENTTQLIEAVQCAGVTNCHIYCLNRADIMSQVCDNLSSSLIHSIAA